MKIITVNIEGHRHFEERLLPFLQKEQADFISLQEVFEVDMPILAEKLGMTGHFYPLADITETSIHQRHALGRWGIAQLSKVPIISGGFEYYQGSEAVVPAFTGASDPNSINRALMWTSVGSPDELFTFATTHFIWTPDGNPTPLQAENLAKLWKILDKLPPYIVMGDFNAPRGRSTFDELASRLKDNVPPEIETSIDGSLHKAGKIMQMVDGMFSTPAYQVEQVRVVDGVSDHKAIVAEVKRVYLNSERDV